MKQILYINRLFIFLFIISFVGCEEFLDEPIQGQQVISNYYQTEDECYSALSSCYSVLSPSDWWENDFFYLVGDICSDDAFKGNSNSGDQSDFGELARFNITPQNEWLENKYRNTYRMVYYTNLVIENTPNAPIDSDIIDEIVAEAKFLRAFAYFELVKNWGGVALLTTPESANSAVHSRATEAEIWSQIESDLNAALVLPSKTEQSSSEVGRATSGAVKAFLVKAYVYQNKWSEAEALAKEIITSGQYNLGDTFDKVWSVDNPNGNGSIFEIQNVYSELYDAGSALPVLTGSRNDGGWGFGTPSSELDNFMQGDPRRDYTIIKEGDYVDEEHTSYDTKLSDNETGRINRKYYLSNDERASSNSHKRAPLNHILMRYADLLLLHAEAAWNNGSESEALASLNKVRARVGLDAVASTGEELILDIYNERRMELALEGHRYYDLKRQAGIEQPSYPRIKEVMEGFVYYNLNNNTDYDAGHEKGSLFDIEKHTLFPIPQADIDLSEGALEQNPNY